MRFLNTTNADLREYLEAESRFLFNYIREGSIVLDVGVGTGRELEQILSSVNEVHGIDFSKFMLQEARKNVGQNKKVRLVQADAENIPYLNNTFDHVISTWNTFSNFENPDKALSEMLRVVKPVGEVILSVYSQNALNAQIKMYEEHGLAVEKFDNDAVYSKEGHISRRFSKERLMEIAYRHDATIQFHNLTPISHIAVLRRNDFISTAL